jgi:hypothetical protein
MTHTHPEPSTPLPNPHVPEIKSLPHGFAAIYLSHNDVVQMWLKDNEDENGEKR